MKLNDAIVRRIQEVCKEKSVNVCDASLKGKTKCSKVITGKRFCEGAGITLGEFFDRDYFNEVEE